MIISFIVAISMIALSVWFYLKVCPSGTTLKSRLGFETSVLTAEIVGCIWVSYYSYSTVGQGTDSAWWPVIALIYCFVLIPSILLLAAITRRLIYRNKIKPQQEKWGCFLLRAQTLILNVMVYKISGYGICRQIWNYSNKTVDISLKYYRCAIIITTGHFLH